MQNHIIWYRTWAPVVARVMFGLMFLHAGYYKIPGTETFFMEVGMTGDAGVPFPIIAVILALILEVVGGIALIIGWRTRLFAFLLAGFILILNFTFYRDISDQATFGHFMSNLGWIGALLYISSFGAGAYSVDHRNTTTL